MSNPSTIKLIPDYGTPPPMQDRLWRWFGSTSITLVIFIPFSLFGWVLFPFVVLATFLTGVLAVVLSRGQSIKGWIGMIFSGILIAIGAWALVTGT
jgi:threonine/homoserine/homoserine lactone efflux protein